MLRKRVSGKGKVAFTFTAVLLCLFAFCSSVITYRVSLLLFALAIVMVVVLAIRSGRMLSFNLGALAPVLPWFFVGIMAVAGYVVGGGYDPVATIALAASILLAAFATENTDWIQPTINVFLAVLFVFAFTTIACYVFPELYAGFIKPTFYPDVPMAQDYRSGLASHYSHNGTFCTVGFIISAAMAFYSTESLNKKRLYALLALVFLAALILTTKRAHLLCGVFAVGFVYLVSNNQHKYLKAIGTAVLTIIAIAVLAPLIPGVEAAVDRLSATFSSGTSVEDNLNNRTYLWDYALSGFSQAPLFGHGWTSYCYRWPDGITVTYMAHNELLNLLYETGSIGTAIVLMGCVSNLLYTFYAISKLRDRRYGLYLRISLCIQVFFIAYSFTSGALFTTVPNLITYFFAIAIMASVRWKLLCEAEQ